MIDFHSHSTASDGTFSPTSLIKQAENLGVTHLALTDHDTISGLDEFLNVPSKVERIPGIELSVDYPVGELHIVGLFIDKDNKAMSELVSEVQFNRNTRNEKMLEKLSSLVKRNVKKEDLTECSDSQLGRPHMAKFLVKNGICQTMNEAFLKYLGEGGLLNVPKKRMSVKRAFDTIKSAGGIVVLAHPSTLGLADSELEELIKSYKSKGLDAIEVYSSHSPDEKKAFYATLANKYGLGISCGSDFHGGNSKVLSLGADIGEADEAVLIDNLYSLAK